MKRRNWLLVSFLGLLVASSTSQGASLVSSYNIYYGHLHNHSDLSDGTGTPTQAYSAARSAGLDFFGLSDHADSLTATEYQSMISAANAYNQDGVFTAFWGFEWSSSTYGHVTVTNCPEYCTTGSQPTFDALLSWLSSRSGVAFCNHPGRQNGSGTEFDHFTDSPSGAIVGMELWNKSIDFATFYYNTGYTTDSRDRSGYYDEALFEGWQIGAAGSEDNHDGTWGSGSYRLAILAGSNTRDDLYSALRARCFYSTLDQDLELSFTVSGNEMGSTIAGGLSQCVVEAADRGHEGFSRIEVIHNGYVVYTQNVAGQTHPVITCILTTQQGDYVYCKVTQNDGDEAISSPVFITSNGPDGPPRAALTAPLDNGPDDLDPASGQVTVNTTQAAFQIQLSDLEGVNDGTVSSAAVSIEGLTLGVDYAFAYNGGTDIITLTPLTGGVFGNGTYAITLSGISDVAGNTMTATILTVLIDTSIVVPQTLRFQQGLNGYSGTVDTMICAGTADTSYGGSTSLNVDTSDTYGGVSQVLLRFDSIIGGAADQIPQYASISSATLRLRSLDTGNGGSLHAMLQPWSDASTWNSLSNGVLADDVESSSAADDSISANIVGDVDLDVTATLQGWVNGTMENSGWVVLPNGTDGWHIASAEHATADYRPELTVTFVVAGPRPPVADAGPDRTVADADGDDVEFVTLDGSESYHPDSPSAWIVSYIWRVDGQVIEDRDDNPGDGVVTVTLALGDHTTQLTVTDNGGASDTDTADITVEVPTLFRDDFESGGFAAGGWVAGSQATVETTSAHSGTYGVLLKKTSYIETTLNTGGATTATLTYWARTSGLRNEYLYVEWSEDGSTWQTLNTLTGTTGWAQSSHDLLFTQPPFMIRFRTNGNAGSDMAMIDDIVITGTGSSSNNNNAPIASDDIAVTNEDSPVTIPVLANDTDADGDALTVISLTQASNGDVTSDGTTVTYTPNENASGADSFTYTISDGKGGTDTATVAVTIDPVDDPPVAGNDAATTPQDTAVTIDVLANDYDVDSSLEVTFVSDPANGTTTINEDKTITYVPDASYSGGDSFTYTLANGVMATVTVTVQDAAATLHVADLDGVVSVRGNSGQWAALVTVTVVDRLGAPVSGATVTGAWSGAASGVGTGITGSDGTVTVLSGNIKGGASVTFTVNNVTHSSLTYAPAGNIETSVVVTFTTAAKP